MDRGVSASRGEINARNDSEVSVDSAKRARDSYASRSSGDAGGGADGGRDSHDMARSFAVDSHCDVRDKIGDGGYMPGGGRDIHTSRNATHHCSWLPRRLASHWRAERISTEQETSKRSLVCAWFVLRICFKRVQSID